MDGGFSDERPIFLQLAERLEEGILSGAYPEQAQVPSITEFASSYRINPATALKGVNLLVEDGLLYKKRGLGMFVSDGARQTLIEKRKRRFYGDRVLPTVREAKRLQITHGELCEMTERGYCDNGN